MRAWIFSGANGWATILWHIARMPDEDQLYEPWQPNPPRRTVEAVRGDPERVSQLPARTEM
jgi:hypothetical protein